MSKITLSSIDPSAARYLNEDAKRRWDQLSEDDQIREVQIAEEYSALASHYADPAVEMDHWTGLLFGDTTRHYTPYDTMKICVAELGMTVPQFQSMPIPEIVDLLKTAYEKKIDCERKAAENPEPGLVEKPEAKKDDDKSPDPVKAEQTSPVARAMVLMYDHKNRFGKLMTVDKILEMIPDTNRAALYRDKNFVATRNALRKSLRMKPPLGFKSSDGKIDAIAEDDDKDDDNDGG